jgi:hypothetical protein
MGFAARPVSGMALVVMGFILDAQALRRERRGQLCRNDIVHSHGAWLSGVRVLRSTKAPRAFALCQVLQAPWTQPHNQRQ